MKKAINLTVVEKTPNSSVLKGDISPIFKGNEPQDLLCGNCGKIIGENVSLDTLKKKLLPENQLVAECPGCGEHNLITKR